MNDVDRQIPPDNPPGGRPGSRSRVFVLFHRLAARFRSASLRVRLVALIVLLTVVPTGLMAAIYGRSTRVAMTSAAQRTLLAAARLAAIRLDAWIDAGLDRVQEHAWSPELVLYLGLPEERRSGSPQEDAAQDLLDAWSGKGYTRFSALLDLNGKVCLVSAPFVPQDLAASIGLDGAGSGSFLAQLARAGQPYLSPVLFSRKGGEALLYFAAPAGKPQGPPLGILVIGYDASVLQSLVDSSAEVAGQGSYAALYDENGLRLVNGRAGEPAYQLVSSLDPARTSRLQDAMRLPRLPEQALTSPDPELAKVFSQPGVEPAVFESRLPGMKEVWVGATARLEGQPWVVTYQQSQSTFLAPVAGQNRLMILMAILLLEVTLLVAILMTRSITGYLSVLMRTAERITAGDLWVRAPESENEIGSLARALNVMTTKLRRTLADMEQNISRRTAELARVSEQMKRRAGQLQNIAEVAHAITAIQDPDQLLQQVAHLISERFGYYHIGIFLIDQTGEWAVLRAANSEGGRRMLARGHKLRVGQVGIVGYVTGMGEPRVAMDVEKDAIYFNNPDLPYTLSEVALPLKVGDRVIGALDVQSMEQSAFQEEDISVLSILADQVAIAIENSRLFSETRRALDELQTLHRQYLRSAWAAMVAELGESGFVYENGQVRPSAELLSADVWDAIEKGQVVLFDPDGEGDPGAEGGEHAGLVVPILVRNQAIGLIRLGEPGEGRRWTEEEISLVKIVADQVGQAIENARLLEETRRRAERERLVAEITGRLRASNDPQVIMQTATSELKQALRARQARLVWPDENQAAAPGAPSSPPEGGGKTVISGGGA